MKKVLDIEKLTQDLQDNLTTKQIADKYNCSTSAVLRTCKRNGLCLPHKPKQVPIRNKHFDASFFNTIDSEEKAYILGFISADGGLDRNWGCKIKLHPKDSDILVKIASVMHCDYSPVLVENNTRISLGLYSVELVNDLAKYGIVNNKTKLIPFAKNVPDEFIIHYMRGAFDGDGSIGSERRTAKFVTGSKPFRDGFIAWYSARYGRVPWNKLEGSTKYRFSFNLSDKPFLDDMYANANISLDRKQFLYDKWYRNL